MGIQVDIDFYDPQNLLNNIRQDQKIFLTKKVLKSQEKDTFPFLKLG